MSYSGCKMVGCIGIIGIFAVAWHAAADGCTFNVVPQYLYRHPAGNFSCIMTAHPVCHGKEPYLGRDYKTILVILPDKAFIGISGSISLHRLPLQYGEGR